MDEPGCGAQFRAAVQVIQGLPRSGSYRPSYEEMLRFYSYYKQATAGRCQGPRPGFWDPIGRYKWDAWHSLGRMSKEEAMAAYVAEMKKVAQKIIDTLPMDETTEEMFGYFEPLYEVIHDMPRPPEAFFKRKGGSREPMTEPGQDEPASSPAPERPEDAVSVEQDGQPTPGGGLAPAAEARQGHQVTSDSEGDVYCDSLEQMEPEQNLVPITWGAPGEPRHHQHPLIAVVQLRGALAGQPLGLSPTGVTAGPEPLVPRGAEQGERGEGRRCAGRSSAGPAARGSQRDPCLAAGEQDAGSVPELSLELPPELEAHVASTVRALQDDMRQVLERLSELEMLTAVQGDTAGTNPGQPHALQETSPWPLTVSPRTLLFLLTWPFVTQWLLCHWQGRKR